MPRHALINNPEHWRTRANEARVIARELGGPEAQSMERIAEEYDQLADRAERSANSPNNAGRQQASPRPDR